MISAVSAETPRAGRRLRSVTVPRGLLAARWPWLLAALGTAVWLALTFKPVVQNDGLHYFAYLPAIVVQRSLDFTDVYAAARAAHVQYDPSLVVLHSDTGAPANAYPVGPAVLSLPFYLVALAVVGTGAQPFASPLTIAYCLASLLAGLLALALCFRLAVDVGGSARAAAVGVAAAALATPFVYYLSFEPSYSHTFSALLATAFVGWWWRTRDERTPRQWLVLGLLGGVMAMTRFQDGALVAIAALDVGSARWRALWLLPGLAVGFAPQLAVDLAQFGSPLPPRAPGDGLQPLPGHYLDVLLSSRHGLLPWHPGIAVAAAGFAFVRSRRLGLAFLVAALVETLIDGAAPDWDGGFALGGRRFLVLTPFLAIGFAAAAARAGTLLAGAATAALAAWNVALMANLTYVIGDERDPGYAGLLIGQLRALPDVPREFVQGSAARALVLWPVLHQAPRLTWGLGLLALESAMVALAALVAIRARPPRTAAGAAPASGAVSAETAISLHR